MVKILLFIAICFSLFSCLRLDDNLYENIETTEYQLDDYNDPEINIPSIYDIPNNLVELVDVYSKTPEEAIPTEIKAIYIGDQSQISSDTIIMYCHGNYGHMDYYWTRAKLLANVVSKNNYGVMMVDYRGYGMSEGEPSEDGLYADVDACLQWLKDRGLSDDRLIIYGFSMGSAPATELTAKPRSLTPHKLILENPFASAAVMVQDAGVLALSPTFFTDLEIDNAEEIKKVNQDFLWMHGKDDIFLNMESHGELIYSNHPGTDNDTKKAYRITGAAHSNLPPIMGIEAYLEMLSSFIKQ